jgi:protein-S-isoprenylcysteine O-methyltransferase Ste14
MDKGKKGIDFANKNRIYISQIVGVILIVLILFTSDPWPDHSIIDALFEFAGFILVVICTLGRLWTLMYVSGYKEDKVVTQGPYSMVRHPLYFFSFIGASGIGLASKNILALLIILVGFVIYYPFVLLSEETRLTKAHGEEYIKYMQKTPRFLPKFSLFSEPDMYNVNVKVFRKSFFDVMWFLWFFLIIRIIERLHTTGLVPVLFQIP